MNTKTHREQRTCRGFLALAAALLAASCATPPPAIGPAAEAPPAAASPEVAAGIDTAADPCQDSYACGSWRTNTELLGDRSRYGRFAEPEQTPMNPTDRCEVW